MAQEQPPTIPPSQLQRSSWEASWGWPPGLSTVEGPFRTVHPAPQLPKAPWSRPHRPIEEGPLLPLPRGRRSADSWDSPKRKGSPGHGGTTDGRSVRNYFSPGRPYSRQPMTSSPGLNNQGKELKNTSEPHSSSIQSPGTSLPPSHQQDFGDTEDSPWASWTAPQSSRKGST